MGVRRGGQGRAMADTTPLHTHTHTHTLGSKETKTSTLECIEISSNAENFSSQECKEKQKSTHTIQIVKQKDDKKVMALRDGSGWGDPIDRPGLPLKFSFNVKLENSFFSAVITL